MRISTIRACSRLALPSSARAERRTESVVRCILGAALVCCGLLAQTVPAAAQTYRDIKALGRTPSWFYHPPLTDVASLKRYARNPRVVKDIDIVLAAGEIPTAVAAQVLPRLQEPGVVTRQASCSTLPEGNAVVDCGFDVGATMDWMAARNLVKGKRPPKIVRNLRWAGKKPFQAFLLRIDTEEMTYVFMVPKPCGNLTLVRTIPKPPPPPLAVSVDYDCVPKLGGKLTVNVKATSSDLSQAERVSVSIDGSPAGELTAPSWSMTSDKPGTYSFAATGKDGKPYRGFSAAPVSVASCPPKPPPAKVPPTCQVTLTSREGAKKGSHELVIDTAGAGTGSPTVKPRSLTVRLSGPGIPDANGQELPLDDAGRATFIVPRLPAGTHTYTATETIVSPDVEENDKIYTGDATCSKPVEIVIPPSTVHFFADGLFGKERRQRPLSELDTLPIGADPDLLFGQCSPMVGGKFGVRKGLPRDWEVAGAIGVGLMLVDTDKKVRKNPLFIDVEVDKYLANEVFLGTGLSLWDITRSQTFTPAWLVHFGVPLNGGRDARVPVYFLGEGRLFFDNIDSADNNYQFWGGVRVMFPSGK
jgi:hypothetical protein